MKFCLVLRNSQMEFWPVSCVLHLKESHKATRTIRLLSAAKQSEITCNHPHPWVNTAKKGGFEMDPKGSHDWSVVSTPELTNKDMVNFLSHSACIAIQYGSCDAGWIVNTRSQKSSVLRPSKIPEKECLIGTFGCYRCNFGIEHQFHIEVCKHI